MLNGELLPLPILPSMRILLSCFKAVSLTAGVCCWRKLQADVGCGDILAWCNIDEGTV